MDFIIYIYCLHARRGRCTVFLRDEDRQRLVFPLSEEEGSEVHTLPLDKGFAGYCATHASKSDVNMYSTNGGGSSTV